MVMMTEQNMFERTKGFYKAGMLMLALLFSNIGKTQTPGLGSWNILNGRISLNKQWNAFGEAQLRTQKFYNHFSYHEVKGGIGYNITDKAAALIGMGQYVTYDPTGNFKSPVSNSEFRMWEQLSLTNNLDRLKLEHRYRIEQRFTSSGYRNRFRYRLNAIIPINKKKVESKTLYVAAFEEIFLTNTKPYFERNRLFGGVGYSFSDLFTLQAGWIRQFDFRANATSFTKDYMQVSLLFDFKLDRSGKEKHPSSMD
jgi:hypothetical protein